MKGWIYQGFAVCLILILHNCFAQRAQAQPPNAFTPKFAFRKSGLELERRTQAGTSFEVVGRRSAVLGYEQRGLESWVYPMKLLDDFELSFRIASMLRQFCQRAEGACACATKGEFDPTSDVVCISVWPGTANANSANNRLTNSRCLADLIM